MQGDWGEKNQHSYPVTGPAHYNTNLPGKMYPQVQS